MFLLILLGFVKAFVHKAGAGTTATVALNAASVDLPGSADLSATESGSANGPPSALDEQALAATPLDLRSPFRNYPLPDTFAYDGRTVVAEYSVDSLLNARTGVYLNRYRPETAVILACDLRTGRMLAVGERRGDTVAANPRLTFGGGFPAASLIKILTATAAMETLGKDVTDSIPQLGGYHTLYRRQLMVAGAKRLPKISLEAAFAKSVNPAFGLLGLAVGADGLRQCAQRMGFNRPYAPACLVPSRIEFADTGFSLAETACGFTQKTTISPWHALAIARGAGDDGFLRSCVFTRAVSDLSKGKTIEPGEDSVTAFISLANLPKLQALMEGTVEFGTGRKGFHQVLGAKRMDKLVLGGKTGSLDGSDPKGRYEWFIGYAKLKDDPTLGVALSIMLIHRTYETIHPSQIAALLIRDWLAAQEKARKARAAGLAA